ncbi:isochorismatase [Capnocytophaga sp. HP1101]
MRLFTLIVLTILSMSMEAQNTKSALILIDIQNDYFPQGKNELVGSEQASLNAKKVLDKFRKNKDLVVHIQHLSNRKDATFFIPNTKGAEIHKNVAPTKDEKVITKHFPNSFRETELLAYLKEHKINHLVIAGMMTHMCVDATVRAGKDMGYTIEVIGDACATKDLFYNNKKTVASEVQNSFLSALSYFYASVISTDDFLKNN